MRNFYKLVLFIALFFKAQVVLCQEAGQYSVFRYTSKNGLPQNSIKALAMDNSRYLWMSTEGGLVRFDGSNFKIYNHINTTGIVNDRFRSIIKTSDGKLITDEYSGNIFEISDGRIRKVLSSGHSKTTGATLYGGLPSFDFFVKLYQKKFPFNRSKNYFEFYSVFPLKNGEYAIRTGQTICLFNKDSLIIEIPTKGNQFTEHFMIHEKVFFFTTKNELFLFDQENRKLIPAKITGELDSIELKQTVLWKNVIWSSTNQFVYLKIHQNLYQLEATENPEIIYSKFVLSNLPNNCFVISAYHDEKSKNLFIGTDSKGLYIFKKKFFNVTLAEDTLANLGNAYYSLCEVDSHHVYAGLGRQFSHEGATKPDFDFGYGTTECIIKDKYNYIYYPQAYGIIKYDQKTKTITKIEGSGNNEYQCFYEEGDSIFTGSLRGIGYIKNDTYHHLVEYPKNKFNYRIEDITRGPDGNIWIAVCTGVSRYNHSTGTLDTVPGLQGICARVLFRHDSLLLIGTYSDGYLAWINNKVIRFPLDRNRYLSHVHSFSIDKKFNMWMSTNKGLLRTKFDNILNFINSPTERISYYYYGEDDGILNTEFNGGCSPPMLKIKNGYSVYPTLEGLVWFIPESLPEIVPDEVILIDEIRVDGRLVAVNDDIVIPSNHENVEFRFSTPYWGNISSLDIDYQLEGFNKKRIMYSGSGNTITFSSLPSGSYILKIRKLNHTNDNVFIEVKLPFTVQKKVYETFSFILLASALSILVLYAILKLNTRRIRIKNQQLEAKIGERTNELQATNIILQQNNEKLARQEKFLKESIKVKDKLVSVISHDIITPLKFISMVSRISKKNKDTIDRGKLLESLGDIEFAADKLHNNATNILNWMKLQNNRIIPRMSHIAIHELVEECIEPMSGMAELRKIVLENRISEEEIIQSDRYILTIILQNLISNAIKYTDQGTVTISAEIEENKFHIKITDTGIGFGEETLSHIENTLAGMKHTENKNETWYLENGLGYSIMADLLPHIKGKLKIASHQGKGSIVQLTIPFITAVDEPPSY